MTRLLLLSYCMTGCLLQCVAQYRPMPSRIVQQQHWDQVPVSTDHNSLMNPVNQAVANTRVENNGIDSIAIYAEWIRYYFDTRQYQKVQQYSTVLAAVARREGRLTILAQSYVWRFRADSALGNYKEAIQHYQLHKKLNDSLFNIAKRRQLDQLEIRFETEQKDHALKLKQQNIELLTREGQLQKAKLQRARFIRNVIIGGAGMLVLLLVLGYNRYQLKLRSNRQMKEQQDEIYKQNLSLRELIDTQDKLLEEKEWLLKEIHHRVKNNLQIVMSLLNTQTAYLDDKDALNAIKESRCRMQAISLIHQKLYQSENMALIDMYTYIHDLVVYLKDGFTGINRISFDLQIAPVKLDVSQSVPVGLILNEAITNAVKYAFTGNGTILISLQQTQDCQITLVIADNGRGFPTGAGNAGKRSMGLMLIKTLSEQLGGTLNIHSHNGVIITVNFKYEEKQAFTGPVAFEEGITDYA